MLQGHLQKPLLTGLKTAYIVNSTLYFSKEVTYIVKRGEKTFLYYYFSLMGACPFKSENNQMTGTVNLAFFLRFRFLCVGMFLHEGAF